MERCSKNGILLLFFVFVSLFFITHYDVLAANNNPHSLTPRSKNASSTASTIKSATASSISDNQRLSSCAAYPDKFSLTYPQTDWTKDPYSNGCTFFTLTADKTSPTPSGAYVLISPAEGLSGLVNSSSPIELARNIMFYIDANMFHLESPIQIHALPAGNATELRFWWNLSTGMEQPPQVALPFVNQLSILPTSPLITAQGAITANHSATSSNQSSSQINDNAPSVTSPTHPNATPADTTGNTSSTSNSSSSTSVMMETSAFYITAFNSKKIYVFEYTAPRGQIFDQYLPSVTEMLYSFKFTGK